ncbi:hypothetical protein R1T16_06205 [Flavobacterium sp. DG1-102-2]|uniref:hypothetical protein n=1 Tax=Flavobacterium sp. DG1-102-2 TaxID=3081663 RepID=UPI0029495712|nr:hypothetical protein [Flavobacterium sp. DG1-102-2]MDV6168009.1 hypothetical protein [Flavobacterium sp. DG1-102-2]
MSTVNNNDNRDRNDRDRSNNNENTGNLGNQNESQRMNSRDNDSSYEINRTSSMGRDNESQDRYRESDVDSHSMDSRGSRTYNEDEHTYEDEQRMGSTRSNRGTENNDWDQNDQMQRSPGRSHSEDQRDASSGSYYSDRDEQRRSDNSTRSNNGDDF